MIAGPPEALRQRPQRDVSPAKRRPIIAYIAQPGGIAMAERLVGSNYTTPDLVAKVTGRALYAEDFRAEGMLFCKLLLSPMPHARVRRIDASRALALPGVRGHHHRRRPARPGRRRARAHQRAAVPGRAHPGAGRGQRGRRRRSHRAHRGGLRAAAVHRRPAREPASRRAGRPARGQRLGGGAAAGRRPAAGAAADRAAQVDRGRLRRRRRRPAADGRAEGAVGVRRPRRAASPAPRWCSTRPSS